jgi:4'-phosphopantetheinyl transferase
MSGSTRISPPASGNVDVWWIDLDRIEDDSPSVLSPDERVRADRFRRPRDRARWVSARVAQRQILTGYAGMAPAELRLTHGIHGKPALLGGSSLHFNFTHAGERAALAVAWAREVGIDLEPVAPALDVSPLLAVACSQTEAARLAALPPVARPEAFLTCWTLKEAYLKGIGAGLSRDPRTVEVELLPDGHAKLADLLAEIEEPRWSLRLLDAGCGWVAAVAVPGQLQSVGVYHWPPLEETAPAQ